MTSTTVWSDQWRLQTFSSYVSQYSALHSVLNRLKERSHRTKCQN